MDISTRDRHSTLLRTQRKSLRESPPFEELLWPHMSRTGLRLTRTTTLRLTTSFSPVKNGLRFNLNNYHLIIPSTLCSPLEQLINQNAWYRDRGSCLTT